MVMAITRRTGQENVDVSTSRCSSTPMGFPFWKADMPMVATHGDRVIGYNERYATMAVSHMVPTNFLDPFVDGPCCYDRRLGRVRAESDLS